LVLSRQAHAPDAARALTFAALVISLVTMILANRSWGRMLLGNLRAPNGAVRWVLGATAALLGLVLFVPAIQRQLHSAPVHLGDLALILGAGLACMAWFEVLKGYRRWRRRGGPSVTDAVHGPR
jgi:Ca2+-transporting ATPase